MLNTSREKPLKEAIRLRYAPPGQGAQYACNFCPAVCGQCVILPIMPSKKGAFERKTVSLSTMPASRIPQTRVLCPDPRLYHCKPTPLLMPVLQNSGNYRFFISGYCNLLIYMLNYMKCFCYCLICCDASAGRIKPLLRACKKIGFFLFFILQGVRKQVIRVLIRQIQYKI